MPGTEEQPEPEPEWTPPASGTSIDGSAGAVRARVGFTCHSCRPADRLGSSPKPAWALHFLTCTSSCDVNDQGVGTGGPLLAAVTAPEGAVLPGNAPTTLVMSTFAPGHFESPPLGGDCRASAAILRAALRSLSSTRPQSPHRKIRSDRHSVTFAAPHTEQILDVGAYRGTTTTRDPYRGALYSSCRRNSAKPASRIDRFRPDFAARPLGSHRPGVSGSGTGDVDADMPRTFRSSIAMISADVASRFVVPCRCDDRRTAVLCCRAAIRRPVRTHPFDGPSGCHGPCWRA